MRTRYLTPQLESLEPRQVMTASFVGGLLSDASTTEGVAAVYRFTIADDTVPLTALTVSAASDNAALLSAAALTLTDFGAGRWQLTVTPPRSGIGTSNISLTISGDGAPVVDTFRFDVVADPNAYSRVSAGWFSELQTPAPGGGASTSSTGGSSGDGSGAPTDGSSEWIVRLTSQALQSIHSVTEAAAALAAPQLGITVVAGLGLPGQLLLRGTAAVSDLRQYFSTNTAFAYYTENFTRTVAAVPNDPSYSQLYGLNNTGQTGGMPDADIDAPEAWNRSTGSRSIVIGVIDTGIDYNHVDLAANIWTNPGEIAGNGIDDDANGFIDDVHGYDFVNNDGDPMDDHYHGTHVAGTIGAVGNNGIGVAGVNWAVSMMALKFLDATGNGTTANAIRAVNYATMMHDSYGVNIRVTNNSWGGDEDDVGLLDAINTSGESNILFVAAAGNDGMNIDYYPSYPGGFDSPYIVTVAATDATDGLAYFSNYGATRVDLAAPGVGVYSTAPGNTYQMLSGTSMATPHVAGAAALALSINPTLTATQLKAALLKYVDTPGGLVGSSVSQGRLNVNSLLQGVGLTVNSVTPAAGSVLTTPPTSFVVNFNTAYDPASVQSFDFTVDGMPASSFTLTDADTITFHFSGTPYDYPGLHTMAIARGAIVGSGNHDPVEEYVGRFRYDDLVLAVVGTYPAAGVTATLPLATLDFLFNEGIDPATVGIDDLQLSQGRVTAATQLDSRTIRYTLTDVAAETTLNYTIAAGALTDQFGNPNVAASGSVALDIDVVPLPTPLLQVGIPGSRAYRTSATSTIATAGDVDGFSITVEAGQKITVVVQPTAAGLRPTVELRSPGGNVIATATATAAGQDVVLQSGAATSAGTYKIYVSGADGTIGLQSLQVTLNAAVEAELHGGAANDALATAQSLDSAFTSIGGGASSAAVLGLIAQSAFTPASESFESGALGGMWSTYSSTTSGRIQLNNTYGTHGGSYALYMDAAGATTLNEAILTVDLAGMTQATLSFWHTERADEETAFSGSFTGHFNADGVAISADGVTWYPLWSAASQTAGVWTQYTFNLATAAAAAGISLNSAFKIKFQQVDESSLPSDGRGWDDITVTASKPADPDWYSFTLNAGQAASIAADHSTGAAVALSLYNTAGVLISDGISTASLDRTIDNFVAPATGVYYVRVTTLAGSPADYSVVVTKQVAFDSGDNHSIATAQNIEPSQRVLGWIDGPVAGTPTTFSGPLDVTGTSLSLGIAPDGSFITPGVGAVWHGVEFLRAGTYIAGYTIAVNGSTYTNGSAGGIASFPVTMQNSSVGAIHSIRITGTPVAGLTFQRTITWADGDDFAVVSTTFTNTSGADFTGLALLDNQDPDPGGTFVTGNDVVGGRRLVVASNTSGAMGLATNDSRGFVSAEGFAVTDPFSIINSPSDPNGATGDLAINVAFDLGTLAAGASTTATFAMIFGTSQAAVEATEASVNYAPTFDPGDYYAITASLGSFIGIATSTPGDAAGEVNNSFDPALALYDSSGTLVASNDNGQGDGRNAVISYTAQATGTYYIRVTASTLSAGPAAKGEYAVSYTVTAAPASTFAVATSSVVAGSVVTTPLTSLTLTFNDAINLSSLAAGDLLVNGQAATGLTIVDAKTATFTFASQPRGTVTFTIAAGAIVDMQQTPLTAFSLQFNYLINSAPVLIASPALTLPSIQEDDVSNQGILVADLLATGAGGNPISDADVGDPRGIAITAADITKGAFEYSLDNGTTWFGIGTPTTASAKLLAADTQTRIRFKPVADAFGTLTAGITFRAWDRWTGTNGGNASVASAGGTTAFSTASSTASITIVGVNDPPSFTKGANITSSSNGSVRTVTGWATSILQGPGSETGQTLTFVVTNDANSLFTVQPTISAGGTLTFTAVVGASGTATVTVQLKDSAGGADTSAAQTFTIKLDAPPNITPIADQTIYEDTSTIALDFSVTDPDTALASLTVSTSTTDATLFPPAGRVVTNLGNGNYRLVVTPAANEYHAGNVTVTVGDGVGSRSTTFTITVVPVNDMPSFTKGPNVTATFATGYNIEGWAKALSSGASNEGLGLTFLVSVDDPTLFSQLPTINSTGMLSFAPLPGKSGVATVTVVLRDNGGTAGGGVDTTAPQTFTIQVDTVAAAAGYLDPSFGVGGIAILDIGEPDISGNAVARQADGKLVVVGTASTVRGQNIAVTRFNADGSLDTSFGTSGVVRVDVTGSDTTSYLTAVKIQDDGKIVAVGGHLAVSDGLILRLNADGTRDTTFGTNGLCVVPGTSSFCDLELLADGTILAFGGAYSSSGFVVRFSAAGVIDTTFGTAGILSAGVGSPAAGNAGAVQPDGKFLIAGGTANGDAFFVNRYNPDGTLDTSFSGDGKATYNIFDTAFARDILLQPDGKILLVGYSSPSYTPTSPTDVTMVRYNADGTVDNTFGVAGKSTLNLGTTFDQGYSAVLAPDGKILIAGFAYGSISKGSIVRVAADGLLDTAFGVGGFVRTSFGAGSETISQMLALPDGNLIVVGSTTVGIDTNLVIAKYLLAGNAALTPTITAIADQTILEDQTVAVEFTVSDPDGPLSGLNLGMKSWNTDLLPANAVTFSDLGGGHWRALLTPGADRFGSGLVVLTATDSLGFQASTSFQLNVTPVNDAPTFVKGADQTPRLGTGAVSIGGWATAISQGRFETGQTLTFDVVADDPSLFLVGPAVSADGTLTYTPAGVLGSTNITVVLRDTGGTAMNGADRSAPQKFRFAVTSAPTIAPITSQTINEDGTLTLDFTVTDLDTALASLAISATASDKTLLPDDRISVTSLGGGLYRLVASPAADRNGSTTITISVNDGEGATVTRPFTLVVSSVNDVPSFVKGADLAHYYTQVGPRVVTNWATNISQGAWESGQTLSFEVVVDNPALFSVAPQIDSIGTLTYTTSGLAGTAVVTVRLRDSGGTARGGVDLSAPQTFTITAGDFASAAKLDPTFDGDGIKTLANPSGSGDLARDVAVQIDGKYVVASTVFAGGPNGFYSTVTRFNADGTRDTTFGTGGIYEFATNIALTAVEVLSSGKIIVAGDTTAMFYVARLNANGTLDTTFGSSGSRTLSTGSTQAPNFSASLAIQADGKIIVTKSAFGNGVYQTAIARFTAAGAVDTTFNTTGYRLLTMPSVYGLIPTDVLVQADGGLLMAGQLGFTGSSTGYDFFMARFTSTGALDTTFGAGAGYVVTSPNNSINPDYAPRIAQRADGKIYLAGSAGSRASVGLFNLDGTLDTSFGVNGWAAAGSVNPADRVTGLVVQADGKILVAGSTYRGATDFDFIITRLDTDGTLDTSYGTGGRLINALSTTDDDDITAIRLQSDGKLAVVGTVIDGSNGGDVFLARINSDGTFDTALGGGAGYVTQGFGTHSMRATATLAMPDGRILMAGFTTTGTLSSNSVRTFWMLKADGSLDTSFGTGGYTFESGTSGGITGLALQTDGKILWLEKNSILGRLNTDGSIDTAFGTGGKVTFYNLASDAGGLLLQPNGSIVVVGWYFNSATGLVDFSALRFTSAGVVDSTFGNAGFANYAGGPAGDRAEVSALLSDGKILIGGYGTITGSGDDFMLMRINADGSLDTTFGTAGIVTVAVSTSTGGDRIRSIVVQPDGKILLAGTAIKSSTDFALVRLNADGSLDSTFGTGGKVITSVSTAVDEVTSMVRQADGKIVLVGTSTVSSLTRFTVVRYNADGSLDNTFELDGIVQTPVGTGNNLAQSAVLDAAGRLLVAGTVQNGNRYEAAALRYILEPTSIAVSPIADQEFDEDGSTGPIDFTVSHPTLPASALTVTATSSNTTLFANDGLVLTNLGDGAWRLVATPAADRNGSAVITIRVYDGTKTYVDAFTINVRPVVDAPRIDLNGFAPGVDTSAVFVEAGGQMSILDPTAVTVADPDTGLLVSATITITNPLDGAAESLAAFTAGTSITASYASGVLTLSGAASVDDYVKVLRTITYVNTATNPHTATRHITFSISNGATTGDAAVSAVSVKPLAPTVTGIYARGVGAGSANWNTSFLSYLATNNLGDASLGYLLSGGANQLKTLPWTNVNTLSIRFSEEVTIAQGDLSVIGSANGTTVPNVTGFAWDSTTHTGTWTFATALPRGKFLLHLGSTIVDAGGTALDGEWNVSSSTTSGNGTAGGDFNFRFNVLPGDFDGSNGVTITEVLQARNRAGKGTGSVGYTYREDMDGSGGITITEVLQGRNRAATSITGLNEPVAPGSTPQSPLELAPLIPGAEEGDYLSIYAALSEEELAPLVEEAIARWEASGLVPPDFDWSKLRFAITDLGPAYLGLGNPDGSILLDDDGAGWGWFVDGSPSDDAEFSGEFAATDPLASSRMDLLTVVMHEIGHALGYPTGAAQGTPAATLMSEFLAVGTRRTPGVAPAAIPSDLLADGSQAAPAFFAAATLADLDYATLALELTTTPNRAGSVGVDIPRLKTFTVGGGFGSKHDPVSLPASSFEAEPDSANRSETSTADRAAKAKRSSALEPVRTGADEPSAHSVSR